MNIEKAIRQQYADGTVVVSNLRNKKGVPFFGKNDTYTVTRVQNWYDGSPMTDEKVDDEIYFRHIEGDQVEYYRLNLPNEGQAFLEKNTMAELRGLSSTELLLLKMGYYKGVKLNGYYDKGDTPTPIEYYISTTPDIDDGGSVIVIGTTKFEHKFISQVDTRNFGCKGDGIADDTIPFGRVLQYQKKFETPIKIVGKLLIKDEYLIDFPLRIEGDEVDLSRNLPITTNSIVFDNTEVDGSGNALKHVFRNNYDLYSNRSFVLKNIDFFNANAEIKNRHVIYVDSALWKNPEILNVNYYSFTGSFLYLANDQGKENKPEMYGVQFKNIYGDQAGGVIGSAPNSETWVVGGDVFNCQVSRGFNTVSPQPFPMDLSGFELVKVDSCVFQGSNGSVVEAIYKTTKNLSITNTWIEFFDFNYPEYVLKAYGDVSFEYCRIPGDIPATINKIFVDGKNSRLTLTNIATAPNIYEFIELSNGATTYINNANSTIDYEFKSKTNQSRRPFVKDSLLGQYFIDNVNGYAGVNYSQHRSLNIYKWNKGQPLPNGGGVKAGDNLYINNIINNGVLRTSYDAEGGRCLKLTQSSYNSLAPNVVFQIALPQSFRGCAIVVSVRYKLTTTSTSNLDAPYSRAVGISNLGGVKRVEGVNTQNYKNQWNTGHIVMGATETTGFITFNLTNNFNISSSDTFEMLISDIEVNLGNELPILGDSKFFSSNTFTANELPTSGYWVNGDVIKNINTSTPDNRVFGWECYRTGEFGTATVPWFRTLYFMNRSSNVTNITTANATDLATALTLVNELKAKLNDKLNADRASGQQASS